MKRGDFSKLATNYRKYRQSYNIQIIKKIYKNSGKNLICADVGAGTGIFSKLICKFSNIKKIYSVEPNSSMFLEGKKFLKSKKVKWKLASAEKTRLPKNSIDIISMASSFHWPNTNLALKEFKKISKKNGKLLLTWNPRVIEKSKDEILINKILKKKYKFSNKKRVSSGRSGITKNLNNILLKSKYFKKIEYFEKTDLRKILVSNYIGAWKSVNDIQYMLGKNFPNFIEDVKKILKNKKYIKVYYLTRVWLAHYKG